MQPYLGSVAVSRPGLHLAPGRDLQNLAGLEIAECPILDVSDVGAAEESVLTGKAPLKSNAGKVPKEYVDAYERSLGISGPS